MRNYALHVAESTEELPGHGVFARLWRNWVARRAIASLKELDDHLLKDIGVDRRDIVAAASVPLSENAAAVLSERQRSFYSPRTANLRAASSQPSLCTNAI